ncbi:MAG TPA: SIMPL domain-containing protein [Kofleriaceae bacterium]|jgi:uncharacterized protein YggE
MSSTRIVSFVIVAVLIAPGIAHLPSAVADTTPDPARPGVMTVTGTATLEIAPDCADLMMTISADDLKPSAATHAVQAKRDALLAALAKIGVERADIKLSFLTMNPIYERSSDSWEPTRVHTYRAEITITATTRKFDQLGVMMDAAAGASASRIASSFRRSDLPQLKTKVRDMALTAARAKAKQMTDAVGIKLGRVVSIAEGRSDGFAYYPSVSNTMITSPRTDVIEGTTQQLTLDVTLGFELPSR